VSDKYEEADERLSWEWLNGEYLERPIDWIAAKYALVAFRVKARREALAEERKALREIVRAEYFSGAELVRARILAALDAREKEEQ